MPGILWSPDSEYAKERRKWESQHSEFGAPGKPFVFAEYPLMLFRAKRPPEGGAKPILEQFIVNDEQEERNMQSRGYVRGPDHALEALEKSEEAVSIAAAERAAQDRWMSDRAKAEAMQVDQSTISHLGEISHEALKDTRDKPRPGRPRKAFSG